MALLIKFYIFRFLRIFNPWLFRFNYILKLNSSQAIYYQSLIFAVLFTQLQLCRIEQNLYSNHEGWL